MVDVIGSTVCLLRWRAPHRGPPVPLRRFRGHLRLAHLLACLSRVTSRICVCNTVHAVIFEQSRWSSARRLREECSPAQLRAAANALLTHGPILPVATSVCCEQVRPFTTTSDIVLVLCD